MVVLDQGFNGDRASQVAVVVKNTAANAGEWALTPGSGWSLEEGHGNLLQYSCLENSMDRGAWQATVHGVSQSRTQLSMHAP